MQIQFLVRPNHTGPAYDLAELAGAILITQVIATTAGAVRLVVDGQIAACVVGVILNAVFILITAYRLRDN
ncbi:hypothetical protein KSC_032840 [Ktedonobacter sp. SOSP1-52]|uniref:hypothetical protein n=1 Tax=Ktedonobacter sp. SOSP1-52 TaxID=2778366 RepID=UPI0019164D1C|nr:hypothetical protein [Ktedonobacter sp. SOSP1-52]GHO64392.1 hypothetical protein KSC_032840 [Ktedonobacter sp. SOSP1-52]